MAEKVHLFVCNELNRIQKRPNTWNTNSIIFVQYFTFLAVKQLNKYPRPAIYSREPPAKLLWIRIRQSIVRLLHVLPYLRGPLQTSTYKLCIYISGRMFLTARWKSTQCQSFSGNRRIRSRQLYVFCWLIEFKVQIK